MAAEPANLPTLVGIVTLEDQSYVVLAGTDASRGGTWVRLGGKFGSYEVVACDPQAETASLKDERGTHVVTARASQVQHGAAQQRAISLKTAENYLAEVEAAMKAKSGYRPYDPTYESRLTPPQKEQVQRMRAAAVEKGQRLYVVEQPWGPAYISPPVGPSLLPSVVKLCPGLTPEDWAQIDEQYRRLIVAGSSAPAPAALKKWQELQAAQRGKKS